jgi:hypothetical protein
VTPLRIWKKDAQECSTGFAALSQLESNSIFSGIIIQTGANRSSTMRIEQYRDYCRYFAAHVNIQPVCRAKSIKGIGVHQRIIWTATVSILFTDLEIVIDVSFVLIDGNTATLLSLPSGRSASTFSDCSGCVCPWQTECQRPLPNHLKPTQRTIVFSYFKVLL